MARVLEGKTALVTGASRGIGRAIARHLAQSGALVAINYASNEAAARQSLADIEAAGGQGFLLQKVLGTAASASELAEELGAELKNRTGSDGLDILVNNAGGAPLEDGSVAATTPEYYDKTTSDNMGNPFWTSKMLLPVLRNNGRIIFMSSGAARGMVSQFAVYTMNKVAVNALTIMLAKDLGPRGITVNCIMPGCIHTDINDVHINDPQMRAMYEQMTPLGRIGTPEDTAIVVHDLATPGWGFVTGQIIDVAGGMGL